MCLCDQRYDIAILGELVLVSETRERNLGTIDNALYLKCLWIEHHSIGLFPTPIIVEPAKNEDT